MGAGAQSACDATALTEKSVFCGDGFGRERGEVSQDNDNTVETRIGMVRPFSTRPRHQLQMCIHTTIATKD